MTPPGEPTGMPRYIYDRRITYDKHRHFTAVEDGRDGITQYWGNALGLVEKLMDPGGVVTEYAWDALCRKLGPQPPHGLAERLFGLRIKNGRPHAHRLRAAGAPGRRGGTASASTLARRGSAWRFTGTPLRRRRLGGYVRLRDHARSSVQPGQVEQPISGRLHRMILSSACTECRPPRHGGQSRASSSPFPLVFTAWSCLPLAPNANHHVMAASAGASPGRARRPPSCRPGDSPRRPGTRSRSRPGASRCAGCRAHRVGNPQGIRRLQRGPHGRVLRPRSRARSGRHWLVFIPGSRTWPVPSAGWSRLARRRSARTYRVCTLGPISTSLPGGPPAVGGTPDSSRSLGLKG